MKLQTLLPLPALLVCIAIFFVWLDFYLLRDVEFHSIRTEVDDLSRIPKDQYKARRISNTHVLVMPLCRMSISYESYLIRSECIPDLPLYGEKILIIN